jgi:hypothetical protein
MTVAYRRRKTDAAFRAGWLEAIGVAYQRLELVLLDRAFNGTEKLVRRPRPWMCWSPRRWKKDPGHRPQHLRSSGPATS